jgi:hypothetical protein
LLEPPEIADLERELRRTSLASDGRGSVDLQKRVSDLTSQVQEISELYEREIQRRSEAESKNLELEMAIEKLKDDQIGELQVCRDHANAHVALYRKKSSALKDQVGRFAFGTPHPF